MDPKAKKTIFVGYDRYTDKVYRVFDPVRKTVERVADVSVEDVMDTVDQILFPLPSAEQEEDFEELIDQDLYIEEHTTNVDSDNDSVDATEDINKTSNKLQKKRGQPLGSKSYQKPSLPTDRVLRNRTNKSVHITAMKASLDPVSYEDAISRENSAQWKRAMDEEMTSLLKNQTWELEDLPTGEPVVSSKWIFKSKLQPDGTIKRYKARLVARGFSQTQGLDYFETFSPVVRYESVRAVLAIAAKHDVELAQFDVKTAFLNSPLEEEIYMQQPEGYDDGSSRVCRLKKGIYGLKQAPRNWNNKFKECITSYGLQQSESDPCIFVKNANTDDWIIMSLYVDDGLIACKRKETVDIFVSLLMSEFEATCHDPSCYDGMEITRNRNSKVLCINQQKYISRMLHRFGMEDSKPAVSLMDSSVDLTACCEDENTEKRFPYREAVGCLNYIATISRLDISYAVNKLARYSDNPQELHWRATKRVMRYLKGTIDISLCYGGSSDELTGYCDSDYAGELRMRRSTCGYIFLLHGGPIAWSSSLQRITALSSSEAE